jgi:hypothetical protein
MNRQMKNEIEGLNGIYDPLIIELNKHQYFYDKKYNLCCNTFLKINQNIFNESEGFQNSSTSSKHKIKILTLKIKYCKIQFTST